MPIIATDILFFLTKVGGGAQGNPNDSIGGAIASTQIVDNTLHNLFDKVSGDQALAGMIDYRACYAKNNHGSITLETTKLWIQTNTSNSEIAIAKALEGAGNGSTTGVMERLANEETAPAGVTFSQPANKAAGILIGDLTTGQVHGIWERRTIGAATPGENAATFQIKLEGDTQQ